jgi:hypothetical protein
MKKLALGLTLAVVAMAACSKDKPKIKLTDASDDSGSTLCDPVAQTGCAATEKCTWFHDDTGDATTDPRKPADGHIGCAPIDGATVDLKGACTYGTPGVTGFDNCKPGLLCDTTKDAEPQGRCEQICDPTLGTNCENNVGCVRKHGVFAAVGAGDATTPGTCQILCDPLLDNDYDGAGTMSAQRAGSPCETDANAGCWGRISSTDARTFFFCSHSVPGTETLVHRDEVVIMEKQLLVACHPGYALGFAGDATGSMKTDCYSYCKPADAIGSSGSGTIGTTNPGTPIALPNPQRPNGDPSDPCSVAKGRTGNFGAVPSATVNGTNGEHCMYTWRFEVDMAGTLFPSPTSNTVGICYDHSKYNDGATPPVEEPACTAVPASDATPMNMTTTGVSLGCLSLTTLGLPTSLTGKSEPISIPQLKNKRLPIEFPSMSNRWQSAAQR